MGDYLNKLVARSLGQGEVVQPRPSSRFEPSPVSVGPGLDGWAVQEETARNQETRDEPAGAPEGTPAIRRRPTGAPARQELVPLGPVHDAAQPGRAPVREPVSRPGPSTPSPVPAVPAENQIVSSPAPQDQAISAESPERATRENLRPAVEPVTRGVVIEEMELSPALPAASPPPDTGPQYAARETSRENKPGPEKASPTSVVVHPQVSAAPPLERTPAASGEPGPPPAPTIKVTIGRVEVRATPPGRTAAKRQPAKAPVMSLDDYLRQRSNGGN